MANKNNTYPYPDHEIRALYDESTIRVYQAYSDVMADAALAKGSCVPPPFKLQLS